MCLIYSPPAEEDRTTDEIASALLAYRNFTEVARSRRAYVDAAALSETSSATTIRNLDGKHTITDGPFVETKEWLGGYFVLECDTLDDVLDLAQQIPIASGGAVEVRPMRDT